MILSIVHAENETHHTHVDGLALTLNTQSFDFAHSKQKTDGMRYGIEIDYQTQAHHYRLYHEKTYTHTTAKVRKDLRVNKYAFKYSYDLDQKSALGFSYATIEDNLIKATNHGHIYGLGYKYKFVQLSQYLSDYQNFSVYQSDIKLGIKKQVYGIDLRAGFIAKYISIQDKEHSRFTQKAKDHYFTTGIKLHAHYESYHASIGTYQGSRLFAVMNDGMTVQHHAMEFKNSYMLDLGKSFGNTLIHLRYNRHETTEVPLDNHGVIVDNYAVEMTYTF